MKIKWLGHSCFLLTSEKGTRVVTDPFDNTVGYKVEEIEAEIVSTSHDHFDHNYVSMVTGNAKHVKGAGKINIDGIEITGVASFHDECQGAKRGKNDIFKFRIDGINVCHLGDLGHVLNDNQIREIGNVDVLLIPVGGVYTIDYKEAIEVINLIKPSIIIPMHYKTPALKFEVDGVENFLSATGGKHIAKQEIEIKKEEIGNWPKVFALDYQ
ncbi:MBL fold metallo-hydrolase [Acetivibrio straminisolvens]|uniref:Zn-dependent hydrolases n=1 Tax=Acetivibrio straminisolvens JCM 21531 TaxID=1294263 RepID=W4V7I8_9FIRM|nr:MBL fold metallo-hydrolase [Acetivibrio straminisolvens]GAE88704.1 Zn-dependent hydrolases [Acetivibrio straminisolvens JCM 21531]